MSAMPAEATELSDGALVRATPGRTQGTSSPCRAERRIQRQAALRARRNWTLLSCAVLGCSFGLTVGILDVLH
jgi:hypothetical protein